MNPGFETPQGELEVGHEVVPEHRRVCRWTGAEVNVSLESETDHPDEVFNRAAPDRRSCCSLRAPRLVGSGIEAAVGTVC
jgi:hypothetical protein